VGTPPVDTEGDGTRDYVDPDSDDDGLPDRWEAERGMDPGNPDSDLGGIPDLLEVGYGTDPLDATGDLPWPRDLLFVVPYNDPAVPDPVVGPDPAVGHLVFSTDIRVADVVFALDFSTSMAEEYENLRDSLVATIVPGVRGVIRDVWFSVVQFQDCGHCRSSMERVQEMTDDVGSVEAALMDWVPDFSCPGQEPYTHVLQLIATGDMTPFVHWAGVSPEYWTCGGGGFGWPCFRPDSMPIVILFGDEHFGDATEFCNPLVTHDDAVDALNSVGAKFIGVNSGPGSGSAHDDMIVIAEGTGSVDVAGAPLVFDIATDGSGLGSQVVEAIRILSRHVPVDTSLRLRDEEGDLVDALEHFVDRFEANVEGGIADPRDPSMVCEGGLEVADLAPVDGIPDTFTDLLPGTAVCFDVLARANWIAPETHEPQVFAVDVALLADGAAVGAGRQLRFLVPPLVEIYCGE
jgi:hypothetical protein